MISLHQFHPFPPSKWSITTLVLLITLNLPICYSISTLKWYNSCGNSFNCGNVTNVGFPFWGGDSRPKNCGYSELQLSCENNVTKIEIMGMKYNVLDLNENTQIVRLAREDFVQGICLHQFINTKLDFKLFDYAVGSQNVTVLYGCPTPYVPVSAQFTCKLNGVNDSIGYPELGAQGPSGCSESIVVPVLGSLAPQIGNLTLDQILRQGFETTYKVEDQTLCEECEKSNGRCGFDLNTNKTSCLCPDASAEYTTCTNGSTLKKTRRIAGVALTKPKFVIALTASVLAIGTGMFIVLVFCLKRCCSSHNRVFVIFHPKKQQEVEAFLRNFGSPGLKRYTYTELKRITNSYKDKLGEGGYGAVYKGRLLNGDLVAVKLLKKPKGDAEEFINEVASIGKTNHINIVTLLGFCYEGHKRALVYEFMPNGSLEKFIQGTDKSLAWDKLFQIFVGIARGLEYLHRGCNTRILHFDIKPHNILLDENFSPKISDFGLAKSCPLKESIISMSIARGTVGYIAPEVFLKSFGGVSQKSDVYSYGMLVLEMVGCREIQHEKIECSSDQYFPHWIYKQLDTGNKLDDLEMLSDEERELQRKMVLVSLWCIQPHPSSRPTMTRVVEMLQGTLESIPIPPVPSLASPPRSHQVYSTTTTLSIS